jgi:hypothetical protein
MNKIVEKFILFLNKIGFEQNKDLDEENNNDDEMELFFDMGEVIVKIYSADETYDIYANLPYYDVSQEEYEYFNGNFERDEIGITDNLRQDIYKYWLSKELTYSFKNAPYEVVDSFLMCPGSNIYIGYFINKIKNGKDKIVKFIEAYKSSLSYSSREEKVIFNAVSKTIVNFLTSFGYDNVNGKMTRKNLNQIMIAAINKDFDECINKNDLLMVDEVFRGKECFLFRVGAKIFSINKQSLFEYEKMTNVFGWDFRSIKYFIDTNGLLYFTNELIHGLARLNPNSEKYQDLEYMYLDDEFRKFKNFKTGNKMSILNFTHLTPYEFENLCYDYLTAENFENVHPIGNTNSPDGGKDIIANQIVKTNFGTEKRAYLIQCKHTKKTLQRYNIEEIISLLRENNAEKYLLICSRDISPQTIDRLEKQNNKMINSVEYFGRVEFSMQLSKHPKLITKYKLL